MAETNLLINEIYPAICGESRHSGWPCVLVRLTGCHLRCTWCDSAHSFQGGEVMSIEAILDRIYTLGHRTVLITGGEPLLQADVGLLMTRLVDEGKRVLLETSGTVMTGNALKLSEVPEQVCRVVDVKPPASGIDSQLIDWEGIADLKDRDEIKIVCADRSDYEWARSLIRDEKRFPRGIRTSFSPAEGILDAQDLAEWILADRLDVCLQVQLHKVIWPDAEGGV